jgi:serpin B
MRRSLFALSCLATISLACSDPSGVKGGPPPVITALPRPLTTSEQTVVAASNVFGGRLLGVLSQASPDSNVFFSPLSASFALGMTMNGAAGTTYDEMRATLSFDAQVTRGSVNASYRDLITMLRGLDKRVDLRIANSIWYRDTFGPAIAPAFLADALTYFDARAEGLDFSGPAALTTINNWAKASTNGKIEKVLDAIGPDIVMLLMNAIYFKGDWRDAFDPRATRLESFTPRRGAASQVSMMRRTGNARAAVVDGRTIVELGYGGDAFAMTVVLPRAGEDVNTMATSLGPSFWFSPPAMTVQEVELTMPKFKLTWERRLNDDLRAMGMRTPFVEGGADFTPLSPTNGRKLFISFVKQNTYVDVNEVGTEAAAVTTVGVGIVSLPQRLVVRVDRPFVFALRERLSGTVLFLGRIVRL